MVKARGKVTRSTTPKAAYARLGEPEVEIAVWTPRPNGESPYEQVHFIMHLSGLDIPLIMRFKSPDTLGFFIEELARYRRVVWPEAEPVELETEPRQEKAEPDMETVESGLLPFWGWFLEWLPTTSFSSAVEALDWLVARGERGYPFPPIPGKE